MYDYIILYYKHEILLIPLNRGKMPLNLSSILKFKKKNLSVKYSDKDKIYDVVKNNLASNSFNQN